MGKDEWITPRWILNALGEFDLDPCAALNQPWPTAKKQFTTEDDGLYQEWSGRVWLNPPYGPHTRAWLLRLSDHGTGTALVFARTETETWFIAVWPLATAILFIKGRVTFCHVSGDEGHANSGAPSALIAYGRQDALYLERSRIPGYLVKLR